MGDPVRPRDLAGVLLLAAAYFAAGKLGLSLAFVNESASAVWPPTGIAIAALVLLGLRAWPGVAAGAFLVNWTTTGGIATSAGIAAGNTLEAVVGALLVARLAGGRGAFEEAGRTFGFVAAVLVAAVVSATVGSTTLLLGGLATPGTFLEVWSTWWVGDAVGGLVVAPLLITWATGPRLQAWRAGEAVLVGAALGASLAVVFGLPATRGMPLSFLTLPPLLWAGMRFGPRAAATAAAAISAFSVATTLRGQGPFFVPGDPNTSLLLLQGFIGVAAVTALALAALVAERARAEAELRAARDGLEQAVVARTSSLVETLEALQRSKALLAEAERIAELGSWEWDIAGDRLTWSEQLYRIFGVDPVTFKATYQGWLDRIHPADRARADAVVRQALADHRPFEFEHRIVRPDGERHLVGRGRVFVEGGKVVRMAGTAQDITARRAAAPGTALDHRS